jgi:hypothetical protein
MKLILAAILLLASVSAAAQQWKTLPKGVRILGYRNVTTSKVKSNFNQYGSESDFGSQVRIDAAMIDKMPAFAGTLKGYLPSDVYNNLMAGEYKVDVGAQFNVHGFGFGWGLTNNVMLYGEIAYYNAQVQARLKRTKGNTYEEAADYLEENGGGSMSNATLAANLRSMADVSEKQVQSYMTNSSGYKPLGDWYGSGYGDMETGLMAKVIDRGTWGLMLYPGVILPTGRQDDPDILQDVGFGDGQFDFFSEIGTGYVVNDQLSFGSTLRYTYQAPTSKELRVPSEPGSTFSSDKGDFNIKYGDRINLMFNSTFAYNDWLSFTPIYRYMYQMKSQYDSEYGSANDYLAFNSDRQEHQVQLTTTVSSIQPFLKKKFILPAQINMNLVQTVNGKNVPKVGRFELELRMLF